jgi:hypothetical protein
VKTRRRLHALVFASSFGLVWASSAGTSLAAPPDPGSRLVLKNGTVYLLKEPPRISGTRVVFTTVDGKLFSLDESEVASIGSAPAPTPVPRRYDQEDSRALGAIARQQRDAKGKRAEVAPRAARRTTTPKSDAKSSKPKVRSKRSRPKPTPRAAPGGGTGSPG